MVITDVNQVVYQGDGVTTAFPFTFRIIDGSDIKLLLIDADGAETDITSDYFVDTVNNTVHYPGYAPGAEPGLADQPAPVQEGQRLVVYRELPVTQEKDLGEKWPFFVIELALDKLTMLIQQVKGIWDRCLKVSVGQEATAPDFDYTVPIEAGKTFRVKDDGTGFELTEDPAVAHAAAVAAQEAAERAQGAAETAQEKAEDAQEDSEAAKDAAEAIASQIDIMARALVYDSVAAMKADTTLADGQTTATKGYYSINDGGSSIYAIRAKTQEDVDDGGSIIFLNNGNVAELITDGTVSVKQFGAYGDGTHDDILAIQTAIDTGMPVRITEGTYKTTAPIQIVNKRHIEYDWTNSIINYTGNDCGLYITNAENLSFNIGQLFAYNGDAIKLVGTDLTDWVQYININFDMLRANATTGSCIRGEISGTSWVNEIRINHGRLIQGKYGCLIHRESGTIDNTNHWNFINVGFEGVDIGTFFNNESSVGIICGCIFVGCRYNETRAKLIKSIGKVKYITFFGADSLTYSWFDLDSGADQWQLYEDADNYIYTSIYNGRIYPHGEFMSVAGGRSIESNSDLNDIVIPGSYTVVNNSTASSLSNCPTTVAFRMTISVINGSFTISNPNGKHLLQEIIDLNGDVYTRKFGYDYNDGTKTFLPWRKFSYAKKSTTNQLIVHRVAATFNSFNAYDEGSWRKIVASITFGEVTEGGGDVYISIYNCIADTALGILFVSGNVYFLRTAGNNSMWLTKSDGQRVPASELVGKTGKLHIDCVIS